LNEIGLVEGQVYPSSVVRQAGSTYFLVRLHEDGSRRLGILGPAASFSGSPASDGQITLCRLDAGNAAALRDRLPWLKPVPLGCRPSFGFGDRMGSATPGHIQALRSADPQGRLAPIFAQQSVRENSRTGRTPQQVVDDAMWGVFQEGWRRDWGADADHLKELSDLEAFAAAGYTFFTIDPGDHVDNAAQSDSPGELQKKVATLPWDQLQTSYRDTQARYCTHPFALEGLTLTFDEATLQRALAKVGRALALAITFAHGLAERLAGQAFDFEVSVDETDTPTSVHEHFLIAAELTRCGIPFVSLAPRFVGKFQKGVDYIGALAVFERELERHAAVMRHFGNYRLSVHTGSDKFAIYPALARATHGLIHVKTAGTSYLEALRVVAVASPALFRQIVELARDRFETDRQSYFLDASLDRLPETGQRSDRDLPAFLDHFDSRQILHVTFGSVLAKFGPQIAQVLADNEAEHRAGLESHFARHLAPFVREDDPIE